MQTFHRQRRKLSFGRNAFEELIYTLKLRKVFSILEELLLEACLVF
jgi:hypothetical protein